MRGREELGKRKLTTKWHSGFINSVPQASQNHWGSLTLELCSVKSNVDKFLATLGYHVARKFIDVTLQ